VGGLKYDRRPYPRLTLPVLPPEPGFDVPNPILEGQCACALLRSSVLRHTKARLVFFFTNFLVA